MVYSVAAELRVVGTQFKVNSRDVSTKLTVNEGEVLLRLTTDGESVNLVPHHQVVASLSDTSQLRSVQRADQVHRWKSDLQTEASHGQWIPSLLELGRKLKSAVINGNISEQAATIAYKKAASLNDQQGSLWALPSVWSVGGRDREPTGYRADCAGIWFKTASDRSRLFCNRACRWHHHQ